jgi:hypothetical protein
VRKEYSDIYKNAAKAFKWKLNKKQFMADFLLISIM